MFKRKKLIHDSTLKLIQEKNKKPMEVEVLNKNQTITIPSLPKIKCRQCHRKTVQRLSYVFDVEGKTCNAVSFCHECRRTNYLHTDDYSSPKAKWKNIERGKTQPFPFNRIIVQISERFCSVFNEALRAHSLSLYEICGPSYRKALEILIKDYCIFLHPERKETIVKDDLGKCVKESIDSQTVRDFAERAVWLGNDESHYEKRWTSKSVDDLFKLIEFLRDAIIQDEEKKKLLSEMPEQKKK